jgi:hypothetical protein
MDPTYIRQGCGSPHTNPERKLGHHGHVAVGLASIVCHEAETTGTQLWRSRWKAWLNKLISDTSIRRNFSCASALTRIAACINLGG